ncbi:PA2817 family protein, partial [Marinimicrobium sp. UBA4209]
WYFGGDCLHYMPDEEIAKYQLLDERRHEAIAEGREFSYEHERAKVFGLH